MYEFPDKRKNQSVEPIALLNEFRITNLSIRLADKRNLRLNYLFNYRIPFRNYDNGSISYALFLHFLPPEIFIFSFLFDILPQITKLKYRKSQKQIATNRKNRLDKPTIV